MKCPKQGCDGIMYRFRPEHHVAACHRTATGVLLKLSDRKWKQVGLMCGTCGYMEFYVEAPDEAVTGEGEFFERTEPGPEGLG